MHKPRVIAHGWQFKVSDLGNGRVLKRRLSLLEQILFISWQSRLSLYAVPSRIRRLRHDVTTSTKGLIERLKYVDSTLFGNPLFDGSAQYTQDHSNPLGTAFIDLDDAGIRVVIDRYIGLIQSLWSCGIAERYFHFTRNVGLRSDGNVFLLDIGELIFDKSEVSEQIVGRAWLNSDSYRSLRSPELRDFYAARMSERLTIGILDSIWPDP